MITAQIAAQIVLQIVTIIANVTAMSLMRAQMATTDEARTEAINQGLAGLDGWGKFADALATGTGDIKEFFEKLGTLGKKTE